jgi:hypothetical protein
MDSGKTTRLGETSDLLEEAGIAHAIMDLDSIATVGVPNSRELTYRKPSGCIPEHHSRWNALLDRCRGARNGRWIVAPASGDAGRCGCRMPPDR